MQFLCPGGCILDENIPQGYGESQKRPLCIQRKGGVEGSLKVNSMHGVLM